MQALESATDFQCPIQSRLQWHRDILLSPQGRVQETHPGKTHQGHQGRQLESDNAEHPEGRTGESQEVRRRRSELHQDPGLVAEHRVSS